MILLDTHALIWFIQKDQRVGERGRTIIDTERAGDGAVIAPISVWETAMLADKGKIVLNRSVVAWFEAVLAVSGFSLAELTVAIGVDAGSLPGGTHGDPADRLIIATARALGCPLLTADRAILAYAAVGHLQAIDARR